MSTTKSKKIKHLDASDFADDSMVKAEQGVFQEITLTEVKASLELSNYLGEMTDSERQSLDVSGYVFKWAVITDIPTIMFVKNGDWV